ncbi:hypothetical protein [Pseudolysinimonas sp.]|uniref:hypothetical protein n=1 Tax=Pseudolysinimonas sp. TaxID=2680009 RepID=UPI003F80D128
MITIALPAINLLFVLGIVGGVLAIIDAIVRIRARSAVIGIIQLIAAVLFTLSLFVAGVPFGPAILAVATLILLVLGLAVRGGRARGGAALTVIAIVLLIAYLLFGGGLKIAGINA